MTPAACSRSTSPPAATTPRMLDQFDELAAEAGVELQAGRPAAHDPARRGAGRRAHRRRREAARPDRAAAGRRPDVPARGRRRDGHGRHQFGGAAHRERQRRHEHLRDGRARARAQPGASRAGSGHHSGRRPGGDGALQQRGQRAELLGRSVRGVRRGRSAPTSDSSTIFETLFTAALDGAPDGGGLMAYNYLSGEPITELDEGRPLFLRSPDSAFNLANFMRTHLFASLATLRIGMDVLQKDEGVRLDRMFAHGGLFKTKGVAQRLPGRRDRHPRLGRRRRGRGRRLGDRGARRLRRSPKPRTDPGRLPEQPGLRRHHPGHRSSPIRPTWPASTPSSSATSPPCRWNGRPSSTADRRRLREAGTGVVGSIRLVWSLTSGQQRSSKEDRGAEPASARRHAAMAAVFALGLSGCSVLRGGTPDEPSVTPGDNKGALVGVAMPDQDLRALDRRRQQRQEGTGGPRLPGRPAVRQRQGARPAAATGVDARQRSQGPDHRRDRRHRADRATGRRWPARGQGDLLRPADQRKPGRGLLRDVRQQQGGCPAGYVAAHRPRGQGQERQGHRCQGPVQHRVVRRQPRRQQRRVLLQRGE